MVPRSLIVPVALVALAATGCMTGKPLRVESLNKAIKEAMPASALTSSLSGKAPPATEFAAVWQTKLGQLPDPTKNGVMNRGIVGQAFLFTEKMAAAEIAGRLTVVVNDATDRPAGQSPRQPNIWTFDPETLKRMVVNDDRFGKSVVLFLPWPEDWADVNRLYVQVRYDQPDSFTIYAPPASVTLDFSTTQSIHTSARVPASQLLVPDPKDLMRNAKPFAPPPATPQTNYAATWPTGIGAPPAGAKTTVGTAPPNVGKPAGPSPAGEAKEFQRIVIPRN